jgi:hypothetical protein
MGYSRSSLARLSYSDQARQLAQRLIGAADTRSDGWGHGAFLTEEASEIMAAARELLAAAVIADRQRGCSWAAVGDALGVARQSAQERFVDAEREFREAVLFPQRSAGPGRPGYISGPDAIQDPERARQRLDSWVATAQQGNQAGQASDGLEALQSHSANELIGDVLELYRMLRDDDLPVGVNATAAQRVLVQLKAEAFSAIAQAQPQDARAAAALTKARADLEALEQVDTQQ